MNSVLEENQREWEKKKKKRKEIYMKIKNAAMSLENLIDVNGNVCVCLCIVGARIAPYTSSSNTFDKLGWFRLYLDDFSFFERDSRSNFILREHSICQLCKWNELINFSLLFSLDFSSFDKLINRSVLFKAYYHVKFGLMSFVILALLLLFDRIYQTRYSIIFYLSKGE